MNLLSDNLYQRILLEPPPNADGFKIVSGFASPKLASRHIADLRDKVGHPAQIELVYGMAQSAGMEESAHLGFVKLVTENNNFQCYYPMNPPQIHAKVYTWCAGDRPLACYVGSANYTEYGFGGKVQREAMVSADPQNGLEIFEQARQQSFLCTDGTLVQDNIKLYDSMPQAQPGVVLQFCTASLLSTQTKDVHKRGGLNWGQRGDRERNQAYIPISQKIAKTDFFPPVGEQFTVKTDDGFEFAATRAQDGGKAIHSIESNAIIGAYFRHRLGLESGEFVTKEHLERYGRTDVRFTKLSDKVFQMDFSV